MMLKAWLSHLLKQKQIIKLEGEDYAHYDTESFFVLDRMRRELPIDTFSFAPCEQQIEEETEVNLNLRKIRLSKSEVIDIVRAKIAKRPSDLVEIIKEVFEITNEFCRGIMVVLNIMKN